MMLIVKQTFFSLKNTLLLCDTSLHSTHRNYDYYTELTLIIGHGEAIRLLLHQTMHTFCTRIDLPE